VNDSVQTAEGEGGWKQYGAVSVPRMCLHIIDGRFASALYLVL